MDDTGLTECFRRAADELDVDDRPPIDAILAGRRRVRIRRSLVAVAAVLVVALIGVAVGTSLSSRSASDRIRTIDGGPRAGTDVPTSPADSPTSESSVSTTVPPIETDDPIGELTDRLDSGYLMPVATGRARGVPWSLYLLDFREVVDGRAADGVTECVVLSIGSPGVGRGQACGPLRGATGFGSDGPGTTAFSQSSPNAMITAVVVRRVGRDTWSETRPLNPTWLSPERAAPAGSQVTRSRTVRTPFGDRNIVIFATPVDSGSTG